jgi:hypothetical protein
MLRSKYALTNQPVIIQVNLLTIVGLEPIICKYIFRLLRLRTRAPVTLPVAKRIYLAKWVNSAKLEVLQLRFLRLALEFLLFSIIQPTERLCINFRKYMHSPSNRSSFGTDLTFPLPPEYRARRDTVYSILAWPLLERQTSVVHILLKKIDLLEEGFITRKAVFRIMAKYDTITALTTEILLARIASVPMFGVRMFDVRMFDVPMRDHICQVRFDSRRRQKGPVGALSARYRDGAALIRIIGSCSNCKTRKTKCDYKTPCKACVDYFKDDLVNNPCRRLDPVHSARDKVQKQIEQTPQHEKSVGIRTATQRPAIKRTPEIAVSKVDIVMHKNRKDTLSPKLADPVILKTYSSKSNWEARLFSWLIFHLFSWLVFALTALYMTMAEMWSLLKSAHVAFQTACQVTMRPSVPHNHARATWKCVSLLSCLLSRSAS